MIDRSKDEYLVVDQQAIVYRVIKRHAETGSVEQTADELGIEPVAVEECLDLLETFPEDIHKDIIRLQREWHQRNLRWLAMIHSVHGSTCECGGRFKPLHLYPEQGTDEMNSDYTIYACDECGDYADVEELSRVDPVFNVGDRFRCEDRACKIRNRLINHDKGSVVYDVVFDDGEQSLVDQQCLRGTYERIVE